MEALATLPAGVLSAFAAALGLVVGSFLNVVIHRLPRGESLVRPGSRCPNCARSIRPWENVPLLSWLLLRGRCRGCKAPISWRYPTIELLTAVVFTAIVLRHGASAMTPVWFAFAAALIAAAVIDLDHRIIPDEISVGGLLLAVVVVPWMESLDGLPLAQGFQRSALGALVGGGALWIVGFAHARYAAVSGRRFPHWPDEGEDPPRPSSLDYWIWFPGLGFGDIKLLAMIGAVLGPVGALETIVAACCLGLALGLGWAVVHRRWDAPFGFGPAIAAGALFVALVRFPLL